MEYIFSGLEEEALDISGDELRNNFKGGHGTARHSALWQALFELCNSTQSGITVLTILGLAVFVMAQHALNVPANVQALPFE